jgi:hypothetical protein
VGALIVDIDWNQVSWVELMPLFLAWQLDYRITNKVKKFKFVKASISSMFSKTHRHRHRQRPSETK